MYVTHNCMSKGFIDLVNASRTLSVMPKPNTVTKPAKQEKIDILINVALGWINTYEDDELDAPQFIVTVRKMDPCPFTLDFGI